MSLEYREIMVPRCDRDCDSPTLVRCQWIVAIAIVEVEVEVVAVVVVVEVLQ